MTRTQFDQVAAKMPEIVGRIAHPSVRASRHSCAVRSRVVSAELCVIRPYASSKLSVTQRFPQAVSRAGLVLECVPTRKRCREHQIIVFAVAPRFFPRAAGTDAYPRSEIPQLIFQQVP